MISKYSKKTKKSLENENFKKSKQVDKKSFETEEINNFQDERINFSTKPKNFNTISVNLSELVFSYMNLEELFILRNMNRKIHNIIVGKVKTFRKYIEIKKYYEYVTENFEQFEDDDTLSIFYNNWLLNEKISIEIINYVLSEFLIEKIYKLKIIRNNYFIDFRSDTTIKFLKILVSSYKCPIKIISCRLIKKDDVQKLEDIIRLFKNVPILDIEISKFCEYDYSGVFNALKDNKSIKKLELSLDNYDYITINSIIRKNYESLFRVFKTNTSIEDFSGFITESVQKDQKLFQLLKNCLGMNKSLKNFSLEAIFPKDQMLNLEFMYENSSIKTLQLSGSYCLISLSKLFCSNLKLKIPITSLKLDEFFYFLNDKTRCKYNIQEVIDNKFNTFFINENYKSAINLCVANKKLIHISFSNEFWKFLSPRSFFLSNLKTFKINYFMDSDETPSCSLGFLTILRSGINLESISIESGKFSEASDENLEKATFNLIRENTNLKEFYFCDLNYQTQDKVNEFLKERKIRDLMKTE